MKWHSFLPVVLLALFRRSAPRVLSAVAGIRERQERDNSEPNEREEKHSEERDSCTINGGVCI